MFTKNISIISAPIWQILIKLVLLPLKLIGHSIKQMIMLFGMNYSVENHQGYYVFKPGVKKKQRLNPKAIFMTLLVLTTTNVITYTFFGKGIPIPTPTIINPPKAIPVQPELFLKDKASVFIGNVEVFENKLREVSRKLDIAPEWLMAVIYSESKFNPAAVNFRGSGATGLIQFMATTVKDLNNQLGTQLYMSDIKNMSAVDQLDLVDAYLSIQKERYRGFNNLTDLYLAILFPKALSAVDNSYVMYANPSRAYKQNRGLDENKDGKVSISDIDLRMKRLYAQAYEAPVP